jgi:hypothetical protein
MKFIDSPKSGQKPYTNATPSVVTVGGLVAGTTFTNQTVEDLFNAMLYPELYPTLTAPSNTFALTESGLHEIGETIATLNFLASFSRGSISPAYGTSGYRSGLPNTYNYTGTGLSATVASTSLTNSQTVSSYTVLSGNQSWTNTVSYDAGEQPKSSEGNNYSTPLSAGTTSAQTTSILGVYPWFYNSVSLTVATKQALIAHDSVVTTNMLAEDSINKQFIEFPVIWGAITKLEQYNTLSGLYDVISLSSFTITSTTNTIQGNIINYNRYTYNGPTIGNRILRWTV